MLLDLNSERSSTSYDHTSLSPPTLRTKKFLHILTAFGKKCLSVDALEGLLIKSFLHPIGQLLRPYNITSTVIQENHFASGSEQVFILRGEDHHI